MQEVAEWLKARGFVSAESQLWQDARKFGTRGVRSTEEEYRQDIYNDRY